MEPENLERRRGRWWIRAAWVAAGVIAFFWFAYEDRGLLAVILVGALFALAIGLTVGLRWRRLESLQGWRRLGADVFLGGMAGAAVCPLAVTLMLVKVSLHDHPVPDFTAADVGLVLGRTPVWALAGALVGASLRLLSPVTGGEAEAG